MDITELFIFSRNTAIVLSVSAVSSTVVFFGLAMYEKTLQRTGLVLSMLFGFFVAFPFSGLLGPMGAILVGAATGFGMYAIHRRHGNYKYDGVK